MLIFTIFVILLSIILIYLSISDIKYHEIPIVSSIAALIISIVFVLINSFLLLNSPQIPDIKNSLTGLAVAGGLTALIVILSREKAMGSGDIILFGIMGVSLGLSNLIIGFFLCVYSATIYGIALAIKKKKFYGTQVPLVPFISFGIIVALLFSQQIWEFINKFIGLPILG